MADKIWLGNDTGNEGELNTAANWSPSGVPASGDNLRFPAGSESITADLTALNTATLGGSLGVVIFDDGFIGTVGNSTTNMQFTCTRLEYYGGGVAYIDVQASAISPQIYKTATQNSGVYGLNLIGSALATVNVAGGSVAIAKKETDTSTVATVRQVGDGSSVLLGSGVSLTTFYQTAGNAIVQCAATTVTSYGGTLTTREVGAITTMNNRGGTLYPESTGTITTLTADNGRTDFTKSGAPRTVTTFKQNPGATVIYDPAVLTITNRSAPDYPISLASESP